MNEGKNSDSFTNFAAISKNNIEVICAISC